MIRRLIFVALLVVAPAVGALAWIAQSPSSAPACVPDNINGTPPFQIHGTPPYQSNTRC